MNKNVGAAVGLIAIGLLTVIGFQNCSGFSPSSPDASAVAASCRSQSILRNAYSRGNTFSMPLGSSATPVVCENHSAYDSLVFNAGDQTITLTGSSGSKLFSLNTGGDGCSNGQAVGGDRWKSASGEFLETNLAADVLQVTLTPDIACTIQR